MSAQPYSERAWNAAVDAKATRTKTSLHAAMDAAHDRERLGLDASVCARTFLNEIVESLRSHRTWEGKEDPIATVFAETLLREFDDNGSRP
jgi:hypothetical protein